MSTEKIFAKGFIFKRSEKAPDFVIGSLSLKVEEAIEFMQANKKGEWLNLDVKKSKDGKYYIELNTYEKGGAVSHPVPFSAPVSSAVSEDFDSLSF